VVRGVGSYPAVGNAPMIDMHYHNSFNVNTDPRVPDGTLGLVWRHSTCCTAGGFHVPFRIDGAVSFGQ
jgi:hypothetical protein